MTGRLSRLGLVALALLVGAVGGYAAYGLVGPHTFEDCVLVSMKGVSSDDAARAIRGACRHKFSE